MVSKAIIISALAAAPFVAAHGKPTIVTGNGGGNGTALANQGGVVPLTGSNRVVSPTRATRKRILLTFSRRLK